jgi:alkylation response protein AidB-like acyl-CoA dehydrogenase
MCLTEPHCGTDLGLLRSKAVPQADGSYKITGGKIFISAGEHDMAENIIHLVLARLPDAPAGTKGISLFVVPKFIPNADGSLGARNAITCGALEDKMGIHGSSTCQMNLDDATGWIIGQPNKGLNAMFVMMNAARLGVGMQGLGLTEVAYQNALAYAKERLQMRSLSGPKAPDQAADPIIVHPDVRRMLLTAKAYAEGGRAFSTFIALQIDRELNHPDESVRKDAADMVTLLTPIVKAFMTDNGWIATSEAMQVHGGSGFITGTGVEQYVRDARINMIYEGTNTIQSLDLLGRKILMDNGAKLKKFGALVQAFVEENGTDEAMSEFVTPLADLGDKVTKLTMEIGMKAMQNQDEVGAAAVPYLRVVGHLVYSYFLRPHGEDRPGQAGLRGQFLQGQARHHAFLLRPPAARDGDADTPGAFRRQAAARSRSRTVLMLLVMQDNPLRIQHAKSKLKARPSHPPLAGRLLVSSLRSTVSSRCERIV